MLRTIGKRRSGRKWTDELGENSEKENDSKSLSMTRRGRLNNELGCVEVDFLTGSTRTNCGSRYWLLGYWATGLLGWDILGGGTTMERCRQAVNGWREWIVEGENLVLRLSGASCTYVRSS